jgi:hypothetical protein
MGKNMGLLEHNMLAYVYKHVINIYINIYTNMYK